MINESNNKINILKKTQIDLNKAIKNNDLKLLKQENQNNNYNKNDEIINIINSLQSIMEGCDKIKLQIENGVKIQKQQDNQIIEIDIK